MSDKRYQAGIIQGIAKSHGVGDWPAEIAGLGPRAADTFGECVDCKARAERDKDKRPDKAVDGSWTTYGGKHLCRYDAQRRARG